MHHVIYTSCDLCIMESLHYASCDLHVHVGVYMYMYMYIVYHNLIPSQLSDNPFFETHNQLEITQWISDPPLGRHT